MPHRDALLVWEGREYDHDPKDADWYWSLGIVAVASIIAAILFGNYLLSLLIAIATITIALHSTKAPPLHQFQLTEYGILIGEEIHLFDQMLSFSVLEDIEGAYPPMLSIKTKSWFTPHLIIPLDGVDADVVYSHFLTHVDEADHPHAFTDLVAAWLRF